LEQVPGLDCASGLQTLRGKLPSYLRLLGIFLATHGDDHLKINAALAGGAIQNAEQIAHALKGVAGTLGLTGIHQAALALDDALRGPAPAPETSSLQIMLAERIKETGDALAPIINANPSHPG
jgi:HPt (histidine-containing phosphotransfer) domain-containing protein